MEGYSVTEAASVLGVPTERVWELLARGVLSGAPEGETGMRVYLQPRPAPAPVEAKGPNGDGGAREPDRELSPFRELLTEFRNLTERYGQALLALGEARGEVAALRSRVDLLEARMDLRLPMGPPQAAAWSSSPTPLPVERAVMPAAAVEAPVVPGPSEDAEPTEEERRARARGPRRATESFAEALARAEDPSPPELPGGMEAAAALAAVRHQSDAGSDIGLPRDVAGADEIPIAEAVETLGVGSEQVDEASEVVEPGHATFEPAEEPIPLEPVTALEAEAADAVPVLQAEVEASAAAESAEAEADFEPAAEAEVEAETDAAPAADAEPELETEPEPETAAKPETAVEVEAESRVEETEAEPAVASTDFEVEAKESAPETEALEPATEPEAEPEHAAVEIAEPAATEVEPIAWDAERYTTDIEEPDWFAAEIDDVVDPAPMIDQTEAEPPEQEEAAQTLEAVEPVSATDSVDQEEAVASAEVLAEDDGADEMEVAPTGTQHDETTVETTRTTRTARPFPGADDLEAAIAALRAAGRSAEPAPPSEPLAAAEADDEETAAEWPPRSSFARPSTTTGAPTHGPASRAYRRLRRIFPG